MPGSFPSYLLSRRRQHQPSPSFPPLISAPAAASAPVGRRRSGPLSLPLQPVWRCKAEGQRRGEKGGRGKEEEERERMTGGAHMSVGPTIFVCE